MKVIVSVSSGTNDPTLATLGMLAAKVAVDEGHEVIVWLQGEGVTIANKNVYDKIQGLNMPPMKAVVEALLSANVPIWVCEACAKGRNITPENWISTASYKNMSDYVSTALSMDKSLNF
ncbi:DsrE family protein [Chlorogloeopsis sp. ULAP01]|uniref:DsrE family protein n=1 Tax=Chlorogloeopsis sp. ULAP01 TaxID=3056483 RepID=UPI0025AA6539|nr:DsrE family protein [Chlorogloeopsis sp. ULAP01]MDM9383640.1 DsrE family protein [Chlorogloeopsis sp. ULAP01]